MKQEAQIRLAKPEELPALTRLIEAKLPDLFQPGTSAEMLQRQLGGMLEDGCLIIAETGGQHAGIIALDLMQQQLIACHLNPALLDSRAPRRLIAAAEKRALSFGLRVLCCRIRATAIRFMFSIGYNIDPTDADSAQVVKACKPLERDAEAWMHRIFELNRQLGIPDHYGARHRMPLTDDCVTLESIGFDVYDREQWLHPAAAAAWRKMSETATHAGVVLQVVSAFRSRDYQAGLIRGKLDKGVSIERILTVSAAPGYSQHHSGRALDLKAPGSPPLEESFAQTDAYRWLKANARFFGFHETLGRDNRHGIIWEPWHWCHRSGHRL